MVIVFITKTTSRQNNLRGESLDSEKKKLLNLWLWLLQRQRVYSSKNQHSRKLRGWWPDEVLA